ncbi:ester cyclase [Alkalilimnicola ehrlichii]|nr:ester cyclase [Alkalilimnicola ehrlichii]
MSTTDVVRQEVEALKRHSLADMTDRYTEDAVVHDPMYSEPLRGREAIRDDLAAWLRTFPDLEVEMRAILEEGDRYACEIAMTGTHKGPLITPDGELAPSGKRVAMSIGLFGRLDGDRIAEERRYYDLSSIAAQLATTH